MATTQDLEPEVATTEEELVVADEAAAVSARQRSNLDRTRAHRTALAPTATAPGSGSGSPRKGDAAHSTRPQAQWLDRR